MLAKETISTKNLMKNRGICWNFTDFAVRFLRGKSASRSVLTAKRPDLSAQSPTRAQKKPHRALKTMARVRLRAVQSNPTINPAAWVLPPGQNAAFGCESNVGFSQPCGIEFRPEFARAFRKHISCGHHRASASLTLGRPQFLAESHALALSLWANSYPPDIAPPPT